MPPEQRLDQRKHAVQPRGLVAGEPRPPARCASRPGARSGPAPERGGKVPGQIADLFVAAQPDAVAIALGPVQEGRAAQLGQEMDAAFDAPQVMLEKRVITERAARVAMQRAFRRAGRKLLCRQAGADSRRRRTRHTGRTAPAFPSAPVARPGSPAGPGRRRAGSCDRWSSRRTCGPPARDGFADSRACQIAAGAAMPRVTQKIHPWVRRRSFVRFFMRARRRAACTTRARHPQEGLPLPCPLAKVAVTTTTSALPKETV